MSELKLRPPKIGIVEEGCFPPHVLTARAGPQLRHPNACKSGMRRGPRFRARVMPNPGADPATLNRPAGEDHASFIALTAKTEESFFDFASRPEIAKTRFPREHMSGPSAQNDSKAELRGACEHDFFFIAVALYHPNACKTGRTGRRARGNDQGLACEAEGEGSEGEAWLFCSRCWSSSRCWRTRSAKLPLGASFR
jgi:hypothetical protein